MAVVLLCTGCTTTGGGDDPTKSTLTTMSVWETSNTSDRYNEQYRPRFHFTPEKGWMNDINGFWYQDGVYHLTYQANPKKTSWDNIVWGHATSTDLLHWEQQSPVISAGVNAEGMAFSGTAYVDSENAAGFGENAVILSYTDTARGQCLVYSTDGGYTFQEYEHNPVVVLQKEDGTLDTQQRDPVLTRIDGRWIMVVYVDSVIMDGKTTRGYQFYASDDLKNWEYLSGVPSSRVTECPQFFSIEVEGQPGVKKWVLAGGSTWYWVGEFDGKEFHPETEELQLADGPDIYAGQPLVNAPDGRCITMYWLDQGNGSTVTTWPWRNAATFPTELKLTADAETGYRMTRQPIREICQLYEGDAIIRENITVTDQVDPLEGLYAQCFDLTVTLDVENSQADTVTIQLMDKFFSYQIDHGSLITNYVNDKSNSGLGRVTCPLVDGKATLRFLVDADSVEVFTAGDQYSYTEEFGFEYATKELSITADKEITILSVEFHVIEGIWTT